MLAIFTAPSSPKCHSLSEKSKISASGVGLVQCSLADERITVSEDAESNAGKMVNGPFTAYCEAMVIEKHALEASSNKTYAELDREDPVRVTVMNGSFLRASLFTSVLAFGVSAMAMGLGFVQMLGGLALARLSSRPSA